MNEVSYFDPSDEERRLLALFGEVYEREWDRAAEDDDSSALYGGADNWATLCSIRAIKDALSHQSSAEPVAKLEVGILPRQYPTTGEYEITFYPGPIIPFGSPLYAAPTSAPECVWTEDEDGNWDTACGEKHTFTHDWPQHSDPIKYCCYCSGPIRAVQYAHDEPKWERDNEMLRDALLLTHVAGTVPEDAILAAVSIWSDAECEAAEEWAACVHFAASDNPDVEVPDIPACVRALIDAHDEAEGYPGNNMETLTCACGKPSTHENGECSYCYWGDKPPIDSDDK